MYDIPNWPPTKEQTVAASLAKIAAIKRCGLECCKYLAGPKPCKVVRRFKNLRIDINSALPLPLPGCDKKTCLCIITATK